MIGIAILGVLGQLGCHWSDPDGREAHALDVVQLVDDALPGTTTVFLG